MKRSLHINVNFVTHELHRVTQLISTRGWTEGGSSRQVEASTMPGANHLGAVQLTFPEGGTSVTTAIFNGVKAALGVKEGDFLAVQDDLLALADRHFLNTGNFLERLIRISREVVPGPLRGSARHNLGSPQ